MRNTRFAAALVLLAAIACGGSTPTDPLTPAPSPPRPPGVALVVLCGVEVFAFNPLPPGPVTQRGVMITSAWGTATADVEVSVFATGGTAAAAGQGHGVIIRKGGDASRALSAGWIPDFGAAGTVFLQIDMICGVDRVLTPIDGVYNINI